MKKQILQNVLCEKNMNKYFFYLLCFRHLLQLEKENKLIRTNEELGKEEVRKLIIFTRMVDVVVTVTKT